MFLMAFLWFWADLSILAEHAHFCVFTGKLLRTVCCHEKKVLMMRSDFLCGMVAVPKTFLHAHSFLSYFDYKTSISRQNEFVYLPFQILCTPHIKPRVSRYKKTWKKVLFNSSDQTIRNAACVGSIKHVCLNKSVIVSWHNPRRVILFTVRLGYRRLIWKVALTGSLWWMKYSKL